MMCKVMRIERFLNDFCEIIVKYLKQKFRNEKLQKVRILKY